MRPVVFGILLIVAISVSSCAYLQKTTKRVARVLGIVDHADDVATSEAPPIYREALERLAQQDFAGALQGLETFVREEPASTYTQAAIFHSARALEGLERWSEAVEKYRSVIVVTDTVAPRLQAMALYRLSFCHEALGDDQQSVAALFDALARAQQLPKEVARAELPARLAAAYARTGNFAKSLDYYQQAESGIRALRREGIRDKGVPNWLPRTLYFMGSMALRGSSWDDFETSLRPLSRGQTYLLEAADLGIPPWSERASRDLMATYVDLWRTIETAPISGDGDPDVQRRVVQELQWRRSSLVLENLEELKARSLPAQEREASESKAVREFVAGLEKKIHGLLAQRPAGEGLTPESKERRGVKRGSVVEPDDTLERRFLRGARDANVEETEPRQELPKKIERVNQPPPKDPNL